VNEKLYVLKSLKKVNPKKVMKEN